MNKEFNLETKDEIKRNIDHQVIRLATELKEEIDDNFSKANERLVTQQVLINTLKDRIDKAIKYIENECLDDDYNYCHDLCGNYIFEVLDILKGEEDERV